MSSLFLEWIFSEITKYFLGNETFKATNYVLFGEALRSTAIHIGPAALVVAESTDHDEV